MDPDSTRLLCQSNDVSLNVLARRHHHVCHFIRDDDDVRHRFGNQIGFVGIGINVQLPQDFFFT